MGLLAQYTAAQDASFIQKIHMAAVNYAAGNVRSEVSTTPNHTRRVELARQVLLSPAQFATLFAYAVAGNGNTVADTDGTLAATVATFWDAFAGIAAP